MIAQLDKDYIKTRPLKVWNRLISYAFFEGRPVLTAGRWINPLVFGLFELEKKLPQLKKVNQPIFILGTGRSGTTLLGMLLSMHKSASYLNEPKALWHSVFPYEDIIGNYSSTKARYRLGADDVKAGVIKNAHKLYGFYLRFLGSDRVVDKYPELIFRMEFVKAIFPDAKFLFIVRNGYDTCVSIDTWSAKKGKSGEHETTDWWGKDRRKWNLLIDEVAQQDDLLGKCHDELRKLKDHKNMAAVEWYLSMKEGAKLLEERTENIHLIKFEELTHHPIKTLQSIVEYLQLPEDQKMLQYAHKIVRPVGKKKKFELHPCLLQGFEEMMRYYHYPA